MIYSPGTGAFARTAGAAADGVYGMSGLEVTVTNTSIGAGDVAGQVAKSGAKKVIVIGENMSGRVKPAAQSIGAKWYQAWSKNFPERLMTTDELEAAKARNSRWLYSKINQGYDIYDIGPKGPNITSPFYQLERDILEETGYPTTPLIGF